ncbi:Os10g0559400 [Oryza sativa Japonica Group]|uniref:Retrotransposon protein, putative, unclassified, expressed n=2 Tax=Oryza sativa subsp. japonica TaxID=39947 RepID=Q108Y8_ORYSJ|nr:retrotransposon protein, putative, unclassified, expressed [Oryza sativa Japonica Group]BAF27207.1 Os10g0559400 [Oryza sativa Japonica Group]BAG89019.1 unnamed protein product [Oryza sativa Japonica Group]|eukprot:NP_001065370.1 Os10g0559400 [Oryza sativa Japonica Group]
MIVGDGSRTSFWHDCWIASECLATKFQALYTHTMDNQISVKYALQQGLTASLVPRLSETARQECQCLQDLLQDFSLNNERDIRTGGIMGKFTTKNIYDTRLPPGISSPNWNLIWKCRAPLKVKLFAWLLVRDRLSTKQNLLKKKIVQNGVCDVCQQGDETADHMCFTCPFVQSFWERIRVNPTIQDVWLLHQLKPSPNVPELHHHVFFLLCMWAIWNHRHDVVFRGQTPSIRCCLQRCINEAALWAENLKIEDRHVGKLSPPVI